MVSFSQFTAQRPGDSYRFREELRGRGYVHRTFIGAIGKIVRTNQGGVTLTRRGDAWLYTNRKRSR